jgi:hypothetical protein
VEYLRLNPIGAGFLDLPHFRNLCASVRQIHVAQHRDAMRLRSWCGLVRSTNPTDWDNPQYREWN